MIKYLAIGDTVDKIVFSIFDGTKFKKYGIKLFESLNDINQTQELYVYVSNLIIDNEIDILVVKWFNYYNLKRKTALDLINFRSTLRLACANNKAVYLEVDNYSHEKYIESLKSDEDKTVLETKLSILNRAYGINLYKDDKNLLKDGGTVADTILLGEAIAHQRIYKKPKQLIDYKWTLKIKQ